MSADANKMLIKCKVNGQSVSCEIPVECTLLTFLREYLSLTGTKGACLEGECGSCTVLVNGKQVNSCLMLAGQVQGCEVLTVEGLADSDGRLDVLQERFLDAGAAQCGYCTPGLLMSARAFLKDNPKAGREELLTALEGNICRCTGYASIVEAVEKALAEVRT